MLSIKNVVINKNKKPLLKNVSLEVADRDVVVVSGKNDLERETLVSAMGMLEKPESGEVFFNGIEESQYSYSQGVIARRENIGFMLSDAVLDEDLSVLDNIELPLVFAGKEGKKRAELSNRALTIVGLVAFKDVLVKNLNEWQKNKVLLARTFVNLPKLIIFSEPCRVCDEQKLSEVLGLLTALNKDGVTIVVSSNRAEYVKVAKRHIVVSDGSIVELKKDRLVKPKEEKKPKRTKTTTAKKPRVKKETKTMQEVSVSGGEKSLKSSEEPISVGAEKISNKPKTTRTKKAKSEVVSNEVPTEQVTVGEEGQVKKTLRKRVKKEGAVNNAN